jgi:predicted RNase H-like nuclease (RuvC/YqgF family)
LTKAIQDQQVEIDALKVQNKNQEAAFKTENAKETALEKEDAELKVRMIEQDRRIVDLDAANASLKTELAQLKAANEDLRATAAKIEALEKMMAVLQKGEKNSVQIAALEKR